jgi:hypothetical protein
MTAEAEVQNKANEELPSRTTLQKAENFTSLSFF